MSTTKTKTTLESWKKAKRHTMTLLSGTEVVIEIPNLAAMLKSGEIPNTLVEAAIGGSSAAKDLSLEDVIQNYTFSKYLIAKTVVEPVITEDDVDEIPAEDQEMLVEIATRQRDVDALGHHLGGLEVQQSFRKFRGLDSGDQGSDGV